MPQQSYLQHLETLGYYPLPRSHPGSPGFSGLLTVLHEKPDNHQPARIELLVQEWDGIITNLHLRAGSNKTP